MDWGMKTIYIVLGFGKFVKGVSVFYRKNEQFFHLLRSANAKRTPMGVLFALAERPKWMLYSYNCFL